MSRLCRRGNGDALLEQEHIPRPCVQLVCDGLGGERWTQDRLHVARGDSVDLAAFDGAHVHFWKESAIMGSGGGHVLW